jgi:septal ring factor EnvC (AmiA/AmiB activator)
LIAAVLWSLAARAEPAPGPADPLLDAKRLELRGVESSLGDAAAKRQALSDNIARIQADRARFESDLLATTDKVRAHESRLNALEERLAALMTRAEAKKKALESRRVVIGEVLAALQRMGRKPPPALLVEPNDILKAIRTSMLLGTLLPGMRAEVDALLVDLEDLTKTRQAIEVERQNLETELAALNDEERRLSTLVDARQTALEQAQADLAEQTETATRLAGTANSLRDLITRLEHTGTAAGRAAEAARESDEKLAALLPNGVPRAAPAPANPGRLSPAVAFASTKGQLALPVTGTALRLFGEDDGLGGSEKGDLLTTRPGAIVAAPADSWVAYAGPYRSFGKVLILNAGGGYYIVLAGMDRINVDLGQFVLAGEPVAVMGDGSTRTAAAIALGAAQPVLYVEFRKDGATIDPGPWWAKPELHKVRG